MTTNLLVEAKDLYKNGQYKMCKEVLMNILKNEKNNGLILTKLGDVSLKMNEYYDAKLFYQKAIAMSSVKLNLYVKYGDLLQFELNDFENAEKQYKKCLVIDNLHQKCLFNFGQLLVKKNEYKKAEKYFLKCLEIDNKKGSVHYRLGHLLFYHLSNTNKALFHLKESTIIQPNITKYHYQYAMILKASNQYKNANKSFEKALELSDYSDASIIYQYSQFLYQCINDKQTALKYRELAAALDGTHYSKNIEDDIKKQDNNNNNNNECIIKYAKLKCIIYGFESAILYLNLYQHTHGNLRNLKEMKIELVMLMFGGRDRINRLSNHFKRVLSKDIRIGLFMEQYDKEYEQIIIESLKKVYLWQYIQFCCDMNTVINVQKQHKLNGDEMLLIHQNGMKSYRVCQILSAPKQFGLSLINIEDIEENIGIKLQDKLSRFQVNITSFYDINPKIYHDIKLEVMKTDFNTNINNLEVIKWINHHWFNGAHKDAFIKFAMMFQKLCYLSATHQVWTADNILMLLLNIEPEDVALMQKKAVILSSLGRNEEADEWFQRTLKRSRFITIYTEYGYFLYQQQRKDECEAIFEEAVKLNPVSTKALIGFARILQRNYKPDKAIYYFQKCIAIDPLYDVAHCRYAECLFYHFKDYQQALYHWNIAAEIRPNSYRTQYRLAMAHLKLNNLKEFEYHLSHSLVLNPKYHQALTEWREYFGEYNPESIEINTKNFVLNGDGWNQTLSTQRIEKKRCFYRNWSEKEFAIWWFDKLAMWQYDDYHDAFKEYYNLFQQCQMNNIWNLFDINKLILKQKIGISNDNHINIILKCIDDNVIRKYQDFKNWIKSVLINKDLLKQFIDSLKDFNIYSFDSFYRNMPSEKKLIKVLGLQQDVTRIWDLFYQQPLFDSFK